MKNLFHILDISAVALHCLHSGKGADQITLASGRTVNYPMHAIKVFTERYLPRVLPLGHCIVVQDAGREYRAEMFADYKGGRESDPEMREIMREAVKGVTDLCLHLGANVCYLPNQEADDLIAFLCHNLPDQKFVYSLDKDLVSLASNSVDIILKLEFVENLIDKGITVEPKYAELCKSLLGDSSDNYGGVKNFGPAAWTKMVDKYGTGILDTLLIVANNFEKACYPQNFPEYLHLQNLAKESKEVALILAQFGEIVEENNFHGSTDLVVKPGSWITCYKLAKLAPELVNKKKGDKFNQIVWRKRVPSIEGVEGVLSAIRGGFVEYLAEFKHLLPTQHLIQAKHIKDDTLDKLRKSFKDSRIIALDWETHAPENENFNKAATKGKYVDARGSTIAGMGITYGDNLEKTMYFQFDHADEENNVSKEFLMEVLGAMPDNVPIVIHNCAFENAVLLSEFGVQFDGMYDTMIMHSHVDEMESAGLKDLSRRYLNFEQTKYDAVIAKGKTMKDYTGAEVFKYGADDPLVTAHLFDLFFIILNLEGTWEFVRDNEFPTVNLLAEAYVKGVSIDWELSAKQGEEDKVNAARCIENMRQLFRDNEDVAEHRKNAEVWYDEEFIVNEPAVTFPINAETFNQPALKFITADRIETFLEDYPAATGREFEEFYQGEARRKKEADIKALAASYAYEDWVETSKDVTFTFIGAKVNLLANRLGISIVKGAKESWEEYLNKLLPIAITAEQKAFHEDIILAVNGDKTSLAKRYTDLGIIKVNGTGTEFNLNSPPQNLKLFYGMLGLPIRVKNFKNSDARVKLGHEKGAPQANESALKEALAYGDVTGWKADVLTNLLEAKKSLTRVNLFYEKFPLWSHPKDNLIHPMFRSCGTESRRPSGSSPNMLQLPKKDEGVRVRAVILPNQAMGHDLVCSADWSGEELRIIAGLSQDPNLLSCYVGDDLRDIHAMVAAEIAGCSYEEFQRNRKSEDKDVAKKYDGIRKAAKSVVFGGNYGIGAAKLAQQLHVPPEEAKVFLDAKKTTYAEMETWKEVVKQDLEDKGYAATNYGSRKHLFNRLNNGDLLEYYKRSAVNYLVQGLAADYLKIVLATLWKRKTFQRHGALFYFGIYDELVWSCHSSRAVSLTKEVHAIMSMGIKGLNVPMLSTPAVGVNFAVQIEVLKDENQILTDELIQIAIDKALGGGK